MSSMDAAAEPAWMDGFTARLARAARSAVGSLSVQGAYSRLPRYSDALFGLDYNLDWTL